MRSRGLLLAEGGDHESARAGYARLHSACVARRAQAPTAQECDIRSLVPLE